MLPNHLNKECWPHFLSLPSSVCVYTPKDSLFMFPGLCTSLRFTYVIFFFFFSSSFLFFFFCFFCKSFTAHLHEPLHFVSFSKRCDGRSKQDAGQLKWFTQEIPMHLLRWDKAALLHFKHLNVAGVAAQFVFTVELYISPQALQPIFTSFGNTDENASWPNRLPPL